MENRETTGRSCEGLPYRGTLSHWLHYACFVRSAIETGHEGRFYEWLGAEPDHRRTHSEPCRLEGSPAVSLSVRASGFGEGRRKVPRHGGVSLRSSLRLGMTGRGCVSLRSLARLGMTSVFVRL